MREKGESALSRVGARKGIRPMDKKAI